RFFNLLGWGGYGANHQGETRAVEDLDLTSDFQRAAVAGPGSPEFAGHPDRALGVEPGDDAAGAADVDRVSGGRRPTAGANDRRDDDGGERSRTQADAQHRLAEDAEPCLGQQ